MPPTKLEENTKANLIRTLEDMASPDRQRAYKKSVPFVHVPVELLEQWSEYSRLLEESAPRLLNMIDPLAQRALREFDQAVLTYSRGHLDLMDVPEILDETDWQGLGHAANALLKKLV